MVVFLMALQQKKASYFNNGLLLVEIHAYIQVSSLRGTILGSVGFSACRNEPASNQSCMSPQKNN